MKKTDRQIRINALESGLALATRSEELIKELEQLNEAYSSLKSGYKDLAEDNQRLVAENGRLAEWKKDSRIEYKTRLSQVSRRFNIPRARVYDIICNYKHPRKPISPNLKVSDEQIAYLKGYIRGTADDCIVSGEDLRTALLKPTKEELFVTKEELKKEIDRYFGIRS